VNHSSEFIGARLLSALPQTQVLQAVILLLVSGACAWLMLVWSVPPWMALAALAGLVVLGLVFLYPFWALFLLIILVFTPMDLGKFTAAQMWGVVTLSVGFLSLIFKRRPFDGGPFFVPMICFGGILLISIFHARFPAPVWNGCRRFFTYFLLYLLILALVDSTSRLRNLLNAFLIVGLINALLGIYTAYFLKGADERAAGLIGNANHLGFLCAFVIPLAFHRFLNTRGLWRRAALLCLCGVLLAGVIVSASRGAALSLVAGLLVIGYQSRRRLWLLSPLILLLVTIIPMAPEVFFRRVSNLGEDVEHSISLDPTTKLTSRGYLHRAGLKVWRDHPIWGVGTGNFGRYFATSNYNPGWNRGVDLPQHNLYLRVLVENGLVGLAFFAWLLWRLACQLWFLLASSERQRDPELRAAAQGLIGSAAIFIVMGMSMDFLYIHELYILFALSTLTYRYAKGELPSSPPLQRESFS